MKVINDMITKIKNVHYLKMDYDELIDSFDKELEWLNE
jgi:hypothetical protein